MSFPQETQKATSAAQWNLICLQTRNSHLEIKNAARKQSVTKYHTWKACQNNWHWFGKRKKIQGPEISLFQAQVNVYNKE